MKFSNFGRYVKSIYWSNSIIFNFSSKVFLFEAYF